MGGLERQTRASESLVLARREAQGYSVRRECLISRAPLGGSDKPTLPLVESGTDADTVTVSGREGCQRVTCPQP